MISLLLVYFGGVGARGLTHATAPSDGAPATCVEAEVRRRTVHVRTDRAHCSGVVVDAHHLRSAGRCFGLYPHVSLAADGEGTARTDAGPVRTNGGAQYLGFEQPDQAEVTYDRPISEEPPAPRTDLAALADGATVVLAGFGWPGVAEPFWRSFGRPASLRYAFGTLRIARGSGRAKDLTAYEVTPRDPAVRLGRSDVGGPAFVVDGCRITWLGTILARRTWPRAGTRIYVRPHSDLK